MNDNQISPLIISLFNNKTLRKLNLSKNNLIKLPNFEEFLKTNNALNEIYLHWNNINESGSNQIFEG